MSPPEATVSSLAPTTDGWPEALAPRTREGPTWLRDVRQGALGALRQKAAEPRSLALRERLLVHPASPAPAAAVTPADLEAYHFPGEGDRLVFVDGHHVPALSTVKPVRGVTVLPLSQAMATRPGAEEHLNRHVDPDDAAVAINTLQFTDGAYVELAPGAIVAEPIHLLFLHTGHAPASSAVRLLVLAGRASQATLVEQHVGLGTAATSSSVVAEIVASPDAVVRHAKLQRECLRCEHESTVAVRQAAGSEVDTFLLMVGGNHSASDLTARLEGKGATCRPDGLFLGAGHQRVTCRTTVEHAAPETTSVQLYKGILDGRAHGSFTGMVNVRHEAQRTNAQQTNRNLLLSKEAMVASTPQLEINADDVKCSHGSTIGRLDQGALFFLRSRGLDAEAARLMLTQAFARDVLERVAHEGVRRLLDGLVTAWFNGRRNLQEKGWPS